MSRAQVIQSYRRLIRSCYSTFKGDPTGREGGLKAVRDAFRAQAGAAPEAIRESARSGAPRRDWRGADTVPQRGW